MVVNEISKYTFNGSDSVGYPGGEGGGVGLSPIKKCDRQNC